MVSSSTINERIGLIPSINCITIAPKLAIHILKVSGSITSPCLDGNTLGWVQGCFRQNKHQTATDNQTM